MASTSPGRLFLTGASSGLGRALARELLGRGWRVALASRNTLALQELAREADPAGARSLVLTLDVSRHQDIPPVIAEAAAPWGGLDVVVANAGISSKIKTVDLRPASFQALLDVNLVGAAETLLAGLPHVRQSPRGLLVGLSSLAAYRGGPLGGAYNASKAALTSFLESLRAELADEGVRVLDVRPGFVRTPMTDQNAFKMPFLMEVQPAARRLAQAIQQRRSHLTFPRRAGWLMAGLRHMPDPLFDLLARRMARRFRS